MGGSPLYIETQYRFGAYSGYNRWGTSAPPVYIDVYDKSQGFEYVDSIALPAPLPTQSGVWSQYISNNFSVTASAYGLHTSISGSPGLRWGANQDGSYVLTHTADATATNYLFEVSLLGYVDYSGETFPLTMEDNGSDYWSYLYTLEFEERPKDRVLFIDQPHFTGSPLPPEYDAHSLEEITNSWQGMTNVFWLTNSTDYLALDNSPELRQHPVLDQFVEDYGRDPLALTEFVLNEIELTDAIAYGIEEQVSMEAVNIGGLNRGALGAFLERQGSPWEQCALLIYLLRQAGHHAAFVVPTNSNLRMLDTRLSKLLRMQLRGAIEPYYGTSYTTNRLITVNYPWVVANISSNRCVHIFPWLKDTEVVEGLNLYDYMPEDYNSGSEWVRNYVYGDTNILSLSGETDIPRVLFPKFIQQTLNQNYPGLSLDDMGVRVFNRPHHYVRWEDLPEPTLVVNQDEIAVVKNLTSATNTVPSMTNIFNTIRMQIWRPESPGAPILDTGRLRTADLHNRKFLFLSEDGQLRLWLDSFRPSETNQYDFGSADPDLLGKQQLSKAIGGSTNFTLRTIYERYGDGTGASGFLDVSEDTILTNEFRKRSDELTAICLNVGTVSPQMMHQHALDYWEIERTRQTNTSYMPDLREYQGTAAYLMGMNYFHNLSKFDVRNARLHKLEMVSRIGQGLAKLRPMLLGGESYVQPAVDMQFSEMVLAGNGTLHPDSSVDFASAGVDARWIALANGSAEEHHIINSFFGDTNAVSTVSLLQLAEERKGPTKEGIVELDYSNYLQRGGQPSEGYGQPLLRNHDQTMWKTITNMFAQPGGHYMKVYITPGKIETDTESYRGMAALIFKHDAWGALISHNMNGGYGNYFISPDIDPESYTELLPWALQQLANRGYSVSYLSTVINAYIVFPALYSIPSLYGGGSVFYTDPFQSTWSSQVQQTFGVSGGSFNQSMMLGNDSGFLSRASWLSSTMQFIADPVNVMNGEFYLDATDMSLAGPFQLDIRRNYLSQNLSSGHFGSGWKMHMVPYLVRATNDLGTNILYAAEPDGAVVAYRDLGGDTWRPLAEDNPSLNNYNVDGIGSRANMFNAWIQRQVTNSTEYFLLHLPDGGLRRYQTNSYPIVSDSAVLERHRPYLLDWQDARGNLLTFEYGTNAALADYGQLRRIQSSNGAFVGFYYDVYGRVVEAYGSDARRVEYEYDEFGDLVRVVRPDQSEVLYEYEHSMWSTNGLTNLYSTHLLTREIKPDGRVLVNEYDDVRRVTNQLATVGVGLELVRNATFVYTNNYNPENATNLLTGTTTILDYADHVTTYHYSNGLTRVVRDSLDQERVQTWYEAHETNAPAYPRSLKSVTDVRGLLSTYLYDDRGNVTNVTVKGDLLGDGDTDTEAVTQATYNSQNLIEFSRDAMGRTNHFLYTNTWLLARLETWPSNATSSDQMISKVFSYYDVVDSTNGTAAYGLRQTVIEAYGSPEASTTEWTHSGRGFVTSKIRYTGTSDPPVTNYFFHNHRGEVIEVMDADGVSVVYDYDAMGRKILTENYDSEGTKPLAWHYTYYTPNGEVQWQDGPRYDPEDYLWSDYDGAGRKTVDIRWRTLANEDGNGVEAAPGYDLYATTFYEYDPFGNETRRISPLGVVTTNTWDALGRLLEAKVIDDEGSLLSTERMGYEPGGEVAFHTNALGGVTEKQYTSNGLLKFQRNRDGSTNAWRYDLDGRLHLEIQNNGAYWESTYDEAERTRVRIFYSSSGTPLATNATFLDRRGNVLQSMDANHQISTNAYDGLNRLKVAAGPAIVMVQTNVPPFSSNFVQQVSTYTYDGSGRVLEVANALGETVITTKDALDRVVRVEVQSSNATPVRVTSTVYSPDHHSQTVTNGSGTDGLATTTYTDTMGNAVLSIAYPSAGVREYVRSDYDPVGNLESESYLSDTNGSVVTWWSKDHVYDGLNRLRATSDKDGAVTLFDYDAAGNLTNRVMPGGLKWQATYDDAGRLLKEYNVGSGSQYARTNAYTYYSSGEPFAGLLETRTDGRGVVCSFGYDHWLRQTTNAYSGPNDEHDLTTLWTYDARGLLKSVTEVFANATTGPSNTIFRSYSANGQVVSEGISLGGSPLYAASQGWDSAGRRNLLTVAGGNYQFGWHPDGTLATVSGPPGSGTYTYDTAGRLLSRSVGDRTTTIHSRDGNGRALAITNKIGGQVVLGEALSWTGDGLLSRHQLDRADFEDDRIYEYAVPTRRLAIERVNLDASLRWTNTFTFDSGSSNGPGVLTRAAQPQAGGVEWTGGTDGFSRIAAETNSVARRAAYGDLNGPATVSAELDGVPVSVSVIGTNGGQWRTSLDLTPGTHVLEVAADHPSGLFTTNATSWFTNSAADRVTAVYDASGFLTQRAWIKSNGQTNRTQDLGWDARGRLWKVIERDSESSGFNWSAVYDGLGRRLQTTIVWVTNGVAMTSQPTYVVQLYDPEVEFQEMAVSVGGRITWKLYGPDLDGTYGSMNGVGGLEAVWTSGTPARTTISDARGNVLASHDGSTTWHDSRATGYGSVPGYQPASFGGGIHVDAASAWRGRWSDITGLTYLGARYYDPVAGRFLSVDPLGHASDASLYAFANGDPINFFDPDGRLGRNTFAAAREIVSAPIRAIQGISQTLNGNHPWDAINPISFEFVPTQLAINGITAARVAIGIPFSILSGDIFDHQTPFEDTATSISVNGILNTMHHARVIAQDVDDALGVSGTVPIVNGTHFFIGDFIQIIGEELGAITTSSIRAAEVIRQLHVTDVIAHSQGSSVFRGALPLLSFEQRSIINYQGFGPQSVIGFPRFGLNSIQNSIRPGDPVPWLSPFNLLRRGLGAELQRLPRTQDSIINFGSHGWDPNYNDMIRNP